MRRLIITEPAKKDLAGLDKTTQKRIQAALDKLLDQPDSVALKKLKGKPEEWRMRVGDWRIILYFDQEKDIGYVDRIKHRSTVYSKHGRRQRQK